MTTNKSWRRLPWMLAALLAACTSYGRALSVSPARTEVRLPPDGETTAVFTVTNTHPEDYDVELSEKPWFVYPENKNLRVEEWLKLPYKKHFRLKAGESRDVKIKIHCPKNASGETMGMVSFTYYGKQASMITPMISAAVYLRVAGTERNEGVIAALAAGTRNGHFLIGLQVRAMGNVRLRPVGHVRLLDEERRQISDYVISEPNPIFPGVTVDLSANGPAAPPAPGRYILAAELTSGNMVLQQERKMLVKENGDVEMEAKIP